MSDDARKRQEIEAKYQKSRKLFSEVPEITAEQLLRRSEEEDFVIVALYVDDKTELPESAWYKSPYDQKTKKSIGKQNADFQITRFNNNAQPYYVILDTKGELIPPIKAYDLTIENFVTFLDEAKAEFSMRQK